MARSGWKLLSVAVLGLGVALPAVTACVAHAANPPLNADTVPTVSDALMRQGMEALERSETDKAILLLEQSVTAYPRNAKAFGRLGKAHETAGDPETARKYYEISLSIDPDNIEVLLWDGLAALEADDGEAARERLERLQRVCNSRCAEFRTLSTAVSAKEAGAEAPAEP